VSRPIATLDAWNGTDAPLALRSATGETLALLCDRAITDPRFERTVRAHSGSTLIAWSGHPESAPGDHPFARDPACWLPGALPAFLRRLEALEPLLAASRVRLLVRPHARHIVSDAPRCAALLAAQARSATPHIGLALDPIAMLEPSMIPTAVDHTRRSLEALAHRAALAILTSLTPNGSDDADAWCTPSPIESGAIPGGALVDLFGALIPADCPIALLASEPSAVRDRLARPGYTPA